MNSGPLTPVVKGIAAGIGLVSEGITHHREQRAIKKKGTELAEGRSAPKHGSPQIATQEHEIDSSSVEPDHRDSLPIEVGLEHDEEQWDLDDAQEELVGDTTENIKERARESDPVKMAKRFTDSYPILSKAELGKLSLPVVLPQRRPKNRTRGFIRAYAPELQQCGIDQAMFMDFLETFNQATLASPWLDAINLASLALIAAPTMVSQIAAIAISMAVEVAKNMQSRHRHSNILDQMNNDFYRPRGLFALILTWNPDSNDMKIGVNVNQVIAQNATAPQSTMQKVKHSLRPSMGDTIGLAFSETAPLVFPALDSLAVSQADEDQSFKQKVKSAKGFVSDYWDRRAQAEHAGQHPDSQLNVGPKPVFTSRYSDPNNASNSGDLLALVTGGRLSAPRRGGLLTQRMNMASGTPYGRRGLLSGLAQGSLLGADQQQQQQKYQQFQRPGLMANPIKRVFQHHILYLAIVNMPSDEELAVASEILNQVQKS